MKKTILWILNRIVRKSLIYKKLKNDYESLLKRLEGNFPGHYYSVIPDFENINKKYAKVLENSSALSSIDINIKNQLSLLNELTQYYVQLPYHTESPKHRYTFNNSFFCETDAIVFYAFLRRFRPSRLIEIGSGFSTAIMLDTNELFLKNHCEISCIEPYPERLKSLLHENDRIELIEKKLEDISLDRFKNLDSGDILFIDSTHVSKFGSDVNYYLFNIFPILKSGVIIHIHDIFYPFEYPKDWLVEKKRAWNEVYLVRSFLQNNHTFEILFWNNYLGKIHSEELFTLMPLCEKNIGGSLWLRKK